VTDYIAERGAFDSNSHYAMLQLAEHVGSCTDNTLSALRVAVHKGLLQERNGVYRVSG